ncbi:MAG: GTP-binding protein TypA [Candidatus Zambryskibacteria bacterium RIFCSPLOWO2_01_FULL_39_39]|uniref:50S ribosomal subunit assembly factor BipA n=1 Tax=Candidatus Zambryskibacteria bacterium RIFCSPLOWO2_01_FULL_39_39 TaxID=1802758 RepID=A0A1G2TXH2_9BACT|nr:MAG: GTP-binding protein TypA/BipA [Parcubacteria group bacterium GW2011_GWA1_38_7]OHA87784.1 MAG: GTP-binding protein TypA [Candidatus Zambryskibacteria bacterium RIFCSPHIGHO2_01_FULL_39_63]OHA94991.1 MAG: GTP-binding protein TypA [Candidatus Zambryskibacteria bacterium RIFCSPHIGHO2_02_FULL_39_19]OHA99172.1 MAG: GTP-binding protein TypA [Candidatus Zambryskibacteria bacterium RIFCSPHIGHO2_12_FULL_39_21]OHB01934.1 MAG: GTP-binding protein TypA [Candidatus Zambryskibacteria bacterium RIFCSPLO
MEIRNVAIIAHVDHGKTALTDAILRQTGFEEEGVSMDSNALEKERGITIYSKNASVIYKDTKINLVDTPGHADFGSEVERILRSIDCVLLVVDAQEGPMPQTRFVLKKSLEIGHKPIVVLNKIDKKAADPKRAHDEIFELFFDLGASEEQLDFTTVYAIAKNGVAMKNLGDQSEDLKPLLDTILEKVPKAKNNKEAPLKAQPFNLAYDNFLGRMAIARIYEGTLKDGQKVFVKKTSGGTEEGKITKIFSFEGISRKEIKEAEAGDIVMIAGLPDIYIGDTVTDSEETEGLPIIKVDEPTIALNFLVNNSPFAGKEGKFVTGRQIRDRLIKELEVNVGLKVDLEGDNMEVCGRGELHIAILLENMRREGFELQVSQPQVIIKEIDGHKNEPFEEITIDVPAEMQGVVIEKLGKRGAVMTSSKSHEGHLRFVFEGPTRGLLGYRNQFVIDTKGEGVFASRVIGFRPMAGEIQKKPTGSMVSMLSGKALAFALDNLQTRGTLYIGPTTEVYEGMVIGNTSKGDDMSVNPTKGKQLTNMRASGSDDKIYLAPPTPITIESGLEIMAENEYLEITPKSTRLRKKLLTELERVKSGKKN